MFKIIDISMTIEDGMTVYKNKEEKKPKIYNSSNFQTCRTHETRIDLDCHGGTHIDAPLHMLEDGATIETIGLEQLVGTCRVLDLTHVGMDGIGSGDLKPHNLQRGEWILLKTQNSFTEAFDPNFIFVNEDGARHLIEAGIRGVGIDSLGIERSQPEYTTHRPLFRNGIIIAEGLRLKDVAPGTYFMVIAPLKLTGIDGAPARAFLIGNA